MTDSKTAGNVAKMDGGSMNVHGAQVDALRAVCPGVFSDGKVDFDKLAAALAGHVADEGVVRYGLSWAGKPKCFAEIAKQTTGTLVPARNESVNFDTTENVFIEGENLEVLKILQRSYYGKVKMIYIDPPYNTGKDFVYHDSFQRSNAEENEDAGLLDDAGHMKAAYKQNSKDSGRYHSNWLNMMYPRLYLARNLLRDDGVIFVSIDDNEVHNLRLLMNEIFGEENFVAQFIWKRRQNVDSRAKTGISADHEYILIYRKNDARLRGAEKDLTKYANSDNDSRGAWMSADMTGLATADQRPNLHYVLVNPITKKEYPCPENGWRYSRQTMARLIEEKRVIWPINDSGRPRLKKFLDELTEEFTGLSSILKTVYNTQGTRELKDMFDGKEFFDFPKPSELIRLLIEQGAQEDDIILDFFAGSGTTAHAVMELNKEDGGNRKFICVQIPEEIPEGNEARKAGYATIADIQTLRFRHRIVRHIPLFAPYRQ
jgi:adenine-specific DNA-methyltransferase